MQKPFEAPMYPLPKRPMLRGVARLFDFTGSLDREYRQRVLDYYSRKPEPVDDLDPLTDEEALQVAWTQDAEALASDWNAVINDLNWAFRQYKKDLDGEELT